MALLDPILGPLLLLPSIWVIAIVSFVLSLVTVLLTKFLTDQVMMKQHRDDIKQMQKKSKELRDKPDKLMKLQQEMMSKNMDMMKQSFKPMLITIIPFLLIFAWLNANFTYQPVDPEVPFTVSAFIKAQGNMSLEVLPEINVTAKEVPIVDKKATWNLSGPAGKYALKFTYGETSVEQELIIDSEHYAAPAKKHDSIIYQTTIGNDSLKVDIFGLKLGWIWVYLIFSILFSIVMRKLLKVY